MVYSITYRRPPHVDSSRSSIFDDEKRQSIGGSTVNSEGSSVSFGIPDALSFDRIISGGTCPVSETSTRILDLERKGAVTSAYSLSDSTLTSLFP